MLYITLSESKTELEAVAASHGLSLAGVHIHEVLPPESILKLEEQYTIFHPTDVETTATTQQMLSVIEAVQPVRVVLDSLSELQLLASSSLILSTPNPRTQAVFREPLLHVVVAG